MDDYLDDFLVDDEDDDDYSFDVYEEDDFYEEDDLSDIGEFFFRYVIVSNFCLWCENPY